MKRKSHFIRKQEQRTVPKKKQHFFGTVLLFMILLPYVCTTFMGGVHSYEVKDCDSPIVVIRETEMGTERMPMEEYLVGALAASTEPTYETEALKAQAVVLRTMVYKQHQDRNNKSTDEVHADELQQAYMTPGRMKEYWGADFELYYDRLHTAVQETQGCSIQYADIAVDTPYFLLSAGRTRDGNEAFGSADYPQLQAVESSVDVMAQNYMCRYTYDKSKFMKSLEQVFDEYKEISGAQTISENETTEKQGQPLRIAELTLQRDSSQYVLTVRIGDRSVPGEFFRECFRLNSACFTIEEKKAAVEIVTKGIGHGVGMSQHGANEMAKAGADFMTILQHYFTNIQIQRN